MDTPRVGFTTLLLILAASPLSAATRPALRVRPGAIIASIRIETNNVFETDAPPENKLLYRAANRVHIRTREAVVARELLFAVGDRYDPALAGETERNLRALPFIRRAEIEAIPGKNGTVDLIVRTYDSWTLEIVANFKRAGGATSMKAGLTEHNILGNGKVGSAVYNSDGRVISKTFGYQDPQFLRTRHLQYAMSAVEATNSSNYSLSLARPFYASIVPTSLGGSVTYVSNRVASDGTANTSGLVRKNVAEAGINYGIAVATSTARTRRIKFGLLAHRADFTSLNDQASGRIPDPEHQVFYLLGGEWEELDFITVRRIQKFTHDEDYNLGLGIFPAVKWAPFVRTFDSTDAQILPSLTVRRGFTWSDQFLMLNGGYSSKYVNGGNGNRIASFGAAYFIRGLKYQTLALHVACDVGWHLDPVTPLTLGDTTGLRGYGLTAFSGDRRWLFNIEDRLFVWDELWRLIDVGAVAFFDSGYVWPASRAIKPSELRNSVGVGLRTAPSRSGDNSPVRIDLAYALNDNQSRSRWSVSIQAGQAFGPSAPTPPSGF